MCSKDISQNFSSPIMNAAEWLLTCDVIHQNEAHGPPVVGSGDGSVPFLASSVLKHRIKCISDSLSVGVNHGAR